MSTGILDDDDTRIITSAIEIKEANGIFLKFYIHRRKFYPFYPFPQ